METDYHFARRVLLCTKDPFWDTEQEARRRWEDCETDATPCNSSSRASRPARQIRYTMRLIIVDVMWAFWSWVPSEVKIIPSWHCQVRSAAHKQPEQDCSQTLLSEINIARATFTTPTWPGGKCSKFEFDVFHCIKPMEPVTDLWCKLGRDLGLKPSVGRAHSKWRSPMFQSINRDKIRKLLRSEIYPCIQEKLHGSRV
jgi:hypothetical protein